jgi:hypothetical protein
VFRRFPVPVSAERPSNRVSWLIFFVVFLLLSRVGYHVKMGEDHFFACPSAASQIASLKKSWNKSAGINFK